MKLPVTVRNGLLAVFLMLGAGTDPVVAQERIGWRIVEVSGAVSVTRPGLSPVVLTDSADLQGGELIQTEASGRAILRRGNDTIIVAPGSAIAIPARTDDLVQRILQTFGAILINVEKRPNPNFEVRTPFLAAIVKGTTFTVSADAVSSAVHVVEGTVRVVDSGNSTSAVSVTAGQTARINARSGDGLRVQGGRAAATGQGGDTASLRTDRTGHGGLATEQRGPGLRLAVGVGVGSVDAVKASGGLVRNDSAAQKGADGSPRSERGGGSRASAAASTGQSSAGPPANLIRGGNGASSARAAGPFGGSNGNSGGNNNNNSNNGGGNNANNGNNGNNGGGNGNGNGNGNGSGNGNGN